MLPFLSLVPAQKIFLLENEGKKVSIHILALGQNMRSLVCNTSDGLDVTQTCTSAAMVSNLVLCHSPLPAGD